MDSLKYGVVLGAVIGLVACFLPLGSGLASFWAARSYAAGQTYMVLAAYGAGLLVALLPVFKPPMLRWQAIFAAMMFGFVLIKLRDVIKPFLVDGPLGAKLLIIGPALGLLFAIAVIAKPKMNPAN